MANRYVNPYKVMLGECTRKEIREALQSGELKAAIIPIGATEQHNEHLSLDLEILSSPHSSLSRLPCNSIHKSLSLHLVRWGTPRTTWHGRVH